MLQCCCHRVSIKYSTLTYLVLTLWLLQQTEKVNVNLTPATQTAVSWTSTELLYSVGAPLYNYMAGVWVWVRFLISICFTLLHADSYSTVYIVNNMYAAGTF